MNPSTTSLSLISIPESFWKGILDDVRTALIEELDEGEGTRSTIFGEFNTSLLYGELRPYCSSCRTDYELDESRETPYEYDCAECGKKGHVDGVPDWLRRVCATAAVLVNAEGGASEGRGASDSERAAEPVALSCPKCGGSLLVDGSERLVPCDYCNVSVYLPDAVWFRLHPVATKGRWFIGYSS